ncbi:hypothetical protein M9H77_06160 [Catharanthus roseus]|uniref:Uncharacterized protein n=1 Tax=Catharanthus roseus TaxID=4058 RepID=A0ACC0BRG4_CATRO|nr:hypothetical protein M9H77_06160 [Catharanthus roseus]
MEVLYLNVIIILIFSIFFFFLKNQLQKKKTQFPLPPSPPSLPIIGHFHLLKGPKHRVLKSLSDKYGPIIYLRFGNRPTVVVSSPSLVEECLTKNNDIILANRPQFLLTDTFSYNKTSISFAPYGDLWRNLRRVTTIHVFSSFSLQQSATIRTEEIRSGVQKLFPDSKEYGNWIELNLSCFFEELVQSFIMKMVCGKKWSTSATLFRQIPALIVSNCDYFPMLRWIGFGGPNKKAIELRKQTDKFLQDLIDEGRTIRRCSSSTNHEQQQKTIIQVLLDLQEAEPDYYTDAVIKGTIQIMFTGGTDTSILTMQWVMTYLLNHPEVLEKARNEIDKHIPPGRLIEDLDLPKLSYLRCIINETLRLCPAVPLLLPRFPSEDCIISGYKVPKGTTILINAWAIHRDPSIWEEPTKFKPERFEGIEEGFKFMPFGKGRRSCPGNNLALRFVGLALATLIQCFEWQRLGTELVDLDEKAGITMRKDKPLKGLYRRIILNQKRDNKLPPSPPALPILGHLRLLKDPIHRSLQSISNKYGPIFYLRLGVRATLVVSSPSIAEECFTKNDIVFANRPQSLATKFLSYNNTTVGSAAYGDHWRNLRRVSAINIFSPLSLHNLSAIRVEEIRLTVKKLMSESDLETWKELDLNTLFMELVDNTIMRMTCGKRWYKSADIFKQIIPLTNKFDYFPILKWIGGFGGYLKKLKNLRRERDRVLQDIIDDCRRRNNGEGVGSIDKRKKTVVEALLSVQEAEPNYYTDDIIKGLILKKNKNGARRKSMA